MLKTHTCFCIIISSLPPTSHRCFTTCKCRWLAAKCKAVCPSCEMHLSCSFTAYTPTTCSCHAMSPTIYTYAVRPLNRAWETEHKAILIQKHTWPSAPFHTHANISLDHHMYIFINATQCPTHLVYSQHAQDAYLFLHHHQLLAAHITQMLHKLVSSQMQGSLSILWNTSVMLTSSKAMYTYATSSFVACAVPAVHMCDSTLTYTPACPLQGPTAELVKQNTTQCGYQSTNDPLMDICIKVPNQLGMLKTHTWFCIITSSLQPTSQRCFTTSKCPWLAARCKAVCPPCEIRLSDLFTVCAHTTRSCTAHKAILIPKHTWSSAPFHTHASISLMYICINATLWASSRPRHTDASNWSSQPLRVHVEQPNERQSVHPDPVNLQLTHIQTRSCHAMSPTIYTYAVRPLNRACETEHKAILISKHTWSSAPFHTHASISLLTITCISV